MRNVSPVLALAVLCAACAPRALGDTLASTERATEGARAHRAVDEARPPDAPDDEVPDDRCAVQGWSATLETLLAGPGDSMRGAVAPPRPWDRATAPRYMDRVDRRFALTARERETLTAHGFVVPDRLTVGTYAYAFHTIHQAELPVYVSADAMLHVVASLHDPFVAHLERSTLAPMLARALRRMHEALPAAAPAWPAEVAQDVDLYLAVARSLLESDDGVAAPALGAQPAVRDLAAAARAGNRRSERFLFGRARVVDFTAWELRGHYARDPALARFFRAAVWLSRVEFNLVSRGGRSSHPASAPDARETPREALAAAALAELMERAGAREDIAHLDQAWSLLHGRRDDVSLAQLSTMRDVVHARDLRASDAFERLASIAGNQPRRTAPSGADGAVELPVVASVLGARVRPDEGLPEALVAPAIEGRAVATSAEVAYALGVDRAGQWLQAEYAAHPTLEASVGRLREALRDSTRGNDLLSNWFRGLLALGAPAGGRVPSFMRDESFADLRVNSAVAGYGQFLQREEPRTERAFMTLGCAIPTGWVDPVPDLYASLGAYAERALAVARAIFEWNPEREGAVRDRDRAFLRALDNLSRVSRALRQIAEAELEGRVPGELQSAFLAMVAEVDAADSSGPPAYDGWYFSMFPSVEGAMERADFVAEWGGAANFGQRAWIGSQQPRFGVFVVDNGAMPFVAVGPVARAYEVTTERAAAPDAVARRARTEGRAPWATAWLSPQDPEPPLAITSLDADDDSEAVLRRVLLVRSRENIGNVTIELLDPHGTPLGEVTHPVGARPVRFVFPRVRGASSSRRHRYERGSRAPRYINNLRVQWVPQTIRVRTAGFWTERPARFGTALNFTLGGMSPIDDDGNEMPESSPYGE